MAIPSPEIVVGAISGIGQLGALMMALLGGGAIMAARKGRPGAATADAVRLRKWILALGLLVLALAGAVAMQWVTNTGERQSRLEATLSRPSRLPGQPRLDPTLKELSYAQQVTHPLALTTAEGEALILDIERGAANAEILDIREPAEVEMGTFRGARAIRFPDLDRIQTELRGKKVLLVCHNGNRSSETCQSLAELGIDCRFLAGGLEKWIVEGRTAGGFHRRSLGEVRALPDYPNARRLLETAEVQTAVAERGAHFIDVRYPGEFAAGHLPGATNLPMRRMTSNDIARALASLPDRPVIVPCYDRRSCFFGEVLGLELTRAGRTFLGRYTVPWEYFTPSEPPPHVAAALAQSRKSHWERAADTLAGLLSRLAAIVGLPGAIVLLALASRLLVLPFSLKAERDQIVALRVSAEMTELKRRLSSDPQRLSRAIRALYREHGLTPLRNQLALLLLPVLALSVVAAGRAAEKSRHAFLWIDDLSRPDSLFLLPLLFAVLFTLYIHLTVARTRRWRLAAWLIGVPAFTALGFALPAASAVYLVASAILLLVQRFFVAGGPGYILCLSRRGWRWITSLPAGVWRLDETSAVKGLGNKACRLGVLLAAGLPVPTGVVLDRTFLANWRSASPRVRRRLVRRIARAVGGQAFAVRSSAAAEDGAEQSFAGVYDSVLGVCRNDLAMAIDRVQTSFESARSSAYGGNDPPDGNIIVQRMIAAAHSGVVFTQAPDAAGQMMIEVVEGTGEALVSGLVTPGRYRFGRVTRKPIGDAGPAINLAPLADLAHRVEALFGRPQDIEWASNRGQFHIVQSRDITRTGVAQSPALARHWSDVLALAGRSGPEARLVRSELTELLPRPTEASLSLMARLYASGGSVDRAFCSLGLSYHVEEASPPPFLAVLGRLYDNIGETARRAPKVSGLSLRRLCRAVDDIEARFRKDFAPAFIEAIELQNAVALNSLETPRLMQHAARLVEEYVTEVHVEAEVVNVVADMTARSLTRLAQKTGVDPTTLSRFGGGTTIAQTIKSADNDTYLLRALGHRATLDYELSVPRFVEDPTGFRIFVQQFDPTNAVREFKQGEDLPNDLREAALRAGRMQILKEDAKHVVLRHFAEIRRVLIEIDRRFELDGHIFDLTIEEALSLDATARDQLLDAARARREVRLSATNMPSLPATLTLADLELASGGGLDRSQGDAIGTGKGLRVAGGCAVEGRALVVPLDVAESGIAPPGFRDGDILITPMLSPALLPYMLRSNGVVSEVGGWLSHMAIVARERDVAMIVGAGVSSDVTTGRRVRLHLDGRVEAIDVEADAHRAAAE